jgi:hypothetical protein
MTLRPFGSSGGEKVRQRAGHYASPEQGIGRLARFSNPPYTAAISHARPRAMRMKSPA